MGINSFQVKKSFSKKEVIKDFTFEAPDGKITVEMKVLRVEIYRQLFNMYGQGIRKV